MNQVWIIAKIMAMVGMNVAKDFRLLNQEKGKEE
jgi:hypothetical protein